MSLTYTKVKKHPTTFKRLFGVSIEEFERILKAVDPQWLQAFFFIFLPFLFVLREVSYHAITALGIPSKYELPLN
jgi:hypothetical protein